MTYKQQTIEEKLLKRLNEKDEPLVSGETPSGTSFLVRWEVDVDDPGISPEAAARKVWSDFFDRTQTHADDACVFEVFDRSTGRTTKVDLSETDTDFFDGSA